MKNLDAYSIDYILHNCNLPKKLIQQFAIDCATYALTLVKKPDTRSVESLQVAQRYIDGKASKEEMEAATDSAAAIAATSYSAATAYATIAAMTSAAVVTDTYTTYRAAVVTATYVDNAAAYLADFDKNYCRKLLYTRIKQLPEFTKELLNLEN